MGVGDDAADAVAHGWDLGGEVDAAAPAADGGFGADGLDGDGDAGVVGEAVGWGEAAEFQLDAGGDGPGVGVEDDHRGGALGEGDVDLPRDGLDGVLEAAAGEGDG